MQWPRSSSSRKEREIQLLLAGQHDLDAFRRACERVSDWDGLLQVAQHHGVDGVVLAGAEAVDFASPDPAWESARRRRRRSMVFHDVLCQTLHTVLDALNARGIPTVTLKGPVLARRLYPEEAVRPSTDLDLLIDPSRLDAAVAALAPLGFALEGGEVGRFFRDHHHHVHMLHPTLPPLELHFEAYLGFGTVLPAAPLIASSVPCSIPEWTDARVLSPEDELLYLAVHAASHRFARLVWLLDLKLLLQQRPGLSWDRIAARARAFGLSEAVSCACAELTERLGASSPGFGHLATRGGARSFIARRLTAPRSNHMANAAVDFLFRAVLCDDFARALAFAGRFVRIKLLHEAPRRLRSSFAN